MISFPLKIKRAVTEIIVHCSASPEGRADTIADIRAWHLARGWSGVGYHYVVELDGSIKIGRPIEQVGAHVAGRNTGTIGICYVGGLDANGKPKDTRTKAQKKALVELMTGLIASNPTIKKISGHNQYANKACPSFNADREYFKLTAKHQIDVPFIAPDHERYVIKQRGVVAYEQAGSGTTVSVPKGSIVTATGGRSGDWIEFSQGWIHESEIDQTEVNGNVSSSRRFKGAVGSGLGALGMAASEQAATVAPLADISVVFKALFIALTLAGVSYTIYAAFNEATPGRVREDA